MSADGYTADQASVLASVLIAHIEGGRIHESEVIEGAERRARMFERPVPAEAAIRDAIAELANRGEIERDNNGWLTRAHTEPKP